ncbi:MAG: class II aldolase/adducin family protein [Methylococcales bacterium]
MNIHDREGVVKYELVFEHKSSLDAANLDTLIAWRTVLYRLRLIGQDPERYAGLGFGNISQKLETPVTSGAKCRFAISGTQTGTAERLTWSQFSIVSDFCIRRNQIVAEGTVKPSSEALTHAAVYQARPDIRFVMHVHSPEIWQASLELDIPAIDRTIAYGTPEMARAVQSLVLSRENPFGIFSMLGHEDGIVAYADRADIAGNLLIDTLADALTLSFARQSKP